MNMLKTFWNIAKASNFLQLGQAAGNDESSLEFCGLECFPSVLTEVN